jgi:TPR repeat protein
MLFYSLGMRLLTIFLLLGSALFCSGAEIDAEAVKLYRKAAEQGHAKAQYNLALMYYNGEGVAKDDAAAVEWFCKAAEQGNAMAQYNLGFTYATGGGVAQDDVMAYVWWNLAAAQGHESAKSNKGIISKRMTREQIAEAQKQSREWLTKRSSDDNT